MVRFNQKKSYLLGIHAQSLFCGGKDLMSRIHFKVTWGWRWLQWGGRWNKTARECLLLMLGHKSMSVCDTVTLWASSEPIRSASALVCITTLLWGGDAAKKASYVGAMDLDSCSEGLRSSCVDLLHFLSFASPGAFLMDSLNLVIWASSFGPWALLLSDLCHSFPDSEFEGYLCIKVNSPNAAMRAHLSVSLWGWGREEEEWLVLAAVLRTDCKGKKFTYEQMDREAKVVWGIFQIGCCFFKDFIISFFSPTPPGT